MQTLALTEHPARRWEPRRLRLQLLSIAGRLAVTGRRRLLHLAATAPFIALTLQALATLTRGLTVPTTPGTPRTVEPASTRATSGEPSDPHATFMPPRDENPDDPQDDHAHERSGLGGLRRRLPWQNPG
jgi:hypothetical protein